MSDEKNKKDQADKESKKTKQQNESLLAEINYKALNAIINIHQMIMKHIAEMRERALLEQQELLHKEKEEAAFGESFDNYNEAISKAQRKEAPQENNDFLNWLKDYINGIIEMIKELKSYIEQIDKEIEKTKNDILDMKVALADEIQKFFVNNNPAINIGIAAAIPQALANKIFPNDAAFKMLYLQFANNLGANLGANKIQMNNINAQGQQLAHNALLQHAIQHAPHINQQDQNQLNIMAMQFAMQFQRDLAKCPAAAPLFNDICHKERDLERLIENRNNAVSLLNNCEHEVNQRQMQLKNNATHSSNEIHAFKNRAQIILNDAFNHKDTTNSPVIPALASADTCASQIITEKDSAVAALSSQSMTVEEPSKIAAESIQRMQQAVVALEQSLTDKPKPGHEAAPTPPTDDIDTPSLS